MRINCYIFLLITYLGINQTVSADGYDIKLKLNGLKDTVCYLGNYYGDKQYIKDTAKVNSKGESEFKGKEELPKGIYLIVTPDKKKYFEIIINDEQKFSVEADTSNFMGTMKFKGTNENKLFYDYLTFISNKQKDIEPLNKIYTKLKDTKKDSAEIIRKKIVSLDKEVIDYKSDFIKQYPNTFVTKVFIASKDPEIPETPMLPNGKKDSTFPYRYYKKHYFDNIDFTDDRILRTPIFHSKIDNYLNKMVIPKSDSVAKECIMLIEKARPNKEMFKYLIWYCTRTYELSNVMSYDAIFVELAKKYYLSGDADWAPKSTIEAMDKRVKALEPILLGKKAPNMIMQDTSLNIISMHDIKANFIILYFWDPECGHCQKETPQVIKFYNEKKSIYNLEVFAVCSDTNLLKMKKYIKKEKLNWINVNGPRSVTKNFHDLYDINSTPVIFIINDKKEIIAKKLGSDQLDDFLSNYIKREK